LFPLLLELGFSFGFLLGTTAVQSLASELGSVHGVNGLVGTLVFLEVDESKSERGTVLLAHDDGAGDRSILAECLAEGFIIDGKINVLDEDVGPGLLELLSTNLARDERADIDLLLQHQVVVDHLDGVISALLVLKVNETVSLGFSFVIHGNLTRKDVSEGREGIVEFLVANGVIQVLDEDISDTGLSDGWITLGPHDSARSARDWVVVEAVQCPFSIDNTVEIDIGVAQRPAGEGVSAHTDRGNWSYGVEGFEEETFRDFWSKVADV